MSLLSKYVKKQVKKKGRDEVALWILGIIVKATKTKQDDIWFEKVKKFIRELK